MTDEPAIDETEFVNVRPALVTTVSVVTRDSKHDKQARLKDGSIIMYISLYKEEDAKL